MELESNEGEKRFQKVNEFGNFALPIVLPQDAASEAQAFFASREDPFAKVRGAQLTAAAAAFDQKGAVDADEEDESFTARSDASSESGISDLVKEDEDASEFDLAAYLNVRQSL